MATTAEDFLGQIQGIEKTLGNYETMLPNAPSQIRQEIGKLVDYGRPALQDVATTQNRAYGMLPTMSAEYEGASPLDRTSALSALGRGIQGFGSALGQRDVFQGVAERQGLRIEDIINSAIEAYKTPYELALSRQSRLMPLYQTQVGVEEAQRGRDFTKEQNELQRQYDALEAAKQRAFQTGEREAAQQFQTEQERLSREWQEVENDKNRQNTLRAAAASKPESIDINALLKQINANVPKLFTDWVDSQNKATGGNIGLTEAQIRAGQIAQQTQASGGTLIPALQNQYGMSIAQPPQTYVPSSPILTAPWNK